MRAKTIIRKIAELEHELYNNYDDNQIAKAVNELEKEKPLNSTLVSVIYSGTYLEE